MAIAELSSKFNELHGKKGNYIHYYVKGYHYVRSYSIPFNPRSAAQQENRRTFAEAVKSWQKLPAEEQAVYREAARRTSDRGYNLFISMYMKGKTLPVTSPAGRIKMQDTCFHAPFMVQSNSVSIPFRSGNDPVCLYQPFTRHKTRGLPASPAA